MDKKVALGFFALAGLAFLYFMSYPIAPSYAPIPCNASFPIPCNVQANPLNWEFPLAVLAVGLFIQFRGAKIEGES